jgi:DNA-binding GntR family transcriptional regulator
MIKVPDFSQLTSPRPEPPPKLGHQVAEYLRDAIIVGVYPPGERMAIEVLAEEFGVSTMPVREALITLAHEGLLESLPRRGFRVASIRLEDVEDIFVVHAFIAGVLAGRAASAMTSEIIDQLRHIDEEIRRIGRSERTTESNAAIEQLNYEFHRTINKAPSARQLELFLRSAARFIPRRFYEAVPGWADATIEDHPALIHALERSDAAAARRLMQAHVKKAGDLVIEALRLSGWRQSDSSQTRNSIPRPSDELANDDRLGSQTSPRIIGIESQS